MSPTSTCSDRAPYAVYKLVMVSDPVPVFVRRKASDLGWCQKVPTQENLGERNCQQDEGIAGDGMAAYPTTGTATLCSSLINFR